MDALGLVFTLACLTLAALLYLTHLVLASRRYDREQRSERAEMDGSMASILDFAAERDERIKRAEWAQRERWGRAS